MLMLMLMLKKAFPHPCKPYGDDYPKGLQGRGKVFSSMSMSMKIEAFTVAEET